MTLHDARAAWTALAGVGPFEPLKIVVQTDSPLGRSGWVAILRFDETLTVVAPDERRAAIMRDAFADLTPHEAVLPSNLPPHLDTLGPADVFFTPGAVDTGDEEVVSLGDVQSLLDAMPPDELEETGIVHATSALSIVRVDGEAVAACGWRVWPHDLAHLGVLTHPDHRGRGLAERVGRHAVRRAQDEGMIPMWRARVDPSKEVARRIGLVHLATQLGALVD